MDTQAALRCSLCDTNHKVRVRSEHPLLLSSSLSLPSSLQGWSMKKGLGGWWLSLNDPVYFEQALISASTSLNANKGASKPILAPHSVNAPSITLQMTLLFVPQNKRFTSVASCHACHIFVPVIRNIITAGYISAAFKPGVA